MGRKKKPGDDQRNKQVLQEEEDKQSIFQDAQGPISEADLTEIIKQLLQQQQYAPHSQGAPSTSRQPPISQIQGTRQTRSQSKSGSSTPKPESSTPTQSQTQGLISDKPGKKTIDSYVKKPPTEIWSEVLAKKDIKTQAIEHDKLALSLLASSSQAITKKEYDSDKKEFALQLAQQKPPQVSKPLAVTTVSANNPIDTPYIEKQNVVLNILQIEPEFSFETPNQVALHVFPSGFHFIPTNFQKNHEFYELILVDSGSIGLTRYQSKTDSTILTHSTLQIWQVLTPKQWGQSLHKSKPFSKKVLDLDGYTYWDYCGARYMIHNYQDAMAICAWAGYPDIFVTFTCNPMWPEIIRHCNGDGLKPCDRPEVLSRIFYMKLHKLMQILKAEKIFGTIKAGHCSSS
ncbi:hypothetical protein K1719_045812 [Acacia pycnantha]|nr:hypothetical protein K1719_045812 [Acacia pycnantha]